jgi:hypothetical protein
LNLINSECRCGNSLVKLAFWQALAAGLSFGSWANCVSSGASGEATVNHLNSGAAFLFSNKAQNLGIKLNGLVQIISQYPVRFANLENKPSWLFFFVGLGGQGTR